MWGREEGGERVDVETIGAEIWGLEAFVGVIEGVVGI